MHKVLFSAASDEYETPKLVYQTLNDEFHFTDDPCPLGGVGGLEREWGSSTFVNPPYSKIKFWVKKAFEEHCKGKLVVMLIPSRTDTKWWHEFIMRAEEIRFIKGRLKFAGTKWNAPFPSCIVVFRSKKERA